MQIVNVGSVVFWIAFVAIVVAGHWFRVRSEALKHETLRRIIDKTGNIDEAQLKALVQPGTHGWLREPPPGAGYRSLRVLGTVIMSVALGLTVFFSILWSTGPQRQNTAMLGFASASLIGVVGMGLFFASRFLSPPPLSDRGDRA